MTQGRLYKSARATGPTAEDAIVALPERRTPPAVPDTPVTAPRNAGETHGETHGGTPATAEPMAAASTVDAAAAHDVVAVAHNAGDLFADSAASSEAQPATPQTTDAPPQTRASAAAPDRVAVTDFDHIFADDAVAVDDDDDLFPWEFGAAGTGAATGGGAAPAAKTPATSPASAPAAAVTPATATPAPLVTPVSSKPPADPREGRNTPVVTYRSSQPRIRLTYAGAVTAVVMATTVAGLLEALVSDHIGLLTGVVSLTSAIAGTWYVAERDRLAPTYAFPVAWLLCAVVPGQFTAPPSGSFALKQVVVVLGVLGGNAASIILGTVACYVLARLRPRLAESRG